MEEKQVVNERETLEREKHKVIEKIGNYNESIELRSSSQKVVVLFCSIAWGLYINPGIHTLQVFVDLKVHLNLWSLGLMGFIPFPQKICIWVIWLINKSSLNIFIFPNIMLLPYFLQIYTYIHISWTCLCTNRLVKMTQLATMGSNPVPSLSISQLVLPFK